MSVDLCDTAVRCDPEPGIVAGIVAGRPHPLSTPSLRGTLGVGW